MHIRGTALLSALRALPKLYGEDARARLLAGVPADARAVLGGSILGTGEYPVALQAVVHQGIHDIFGGLTANEAVGRQAAHDDFTGVYRIFLSIITLDLVWSNIARAWSRYNSQGKVLFTERTPLSALCVVSDVEEYNRPMWAAIAGRVKGILELAGAKNVHALVTHCDATQATISLTWQR